MPINFNVDPWYDDFDEAKNFHRILFKPGRAVQARELTQAQTILQDQITKFADNIFKQNSPVTGGNVTTNFDCHFVKLQSTYNNSDVDVSKFDGLLVQNDTGTVIARVIAVASATGSSGLGDPPTLILSYKTGTHFQDNDIVYDTNSNLAAQALTTGATGTSSSASIAQGVFYIFGNFVQIQESTIILDKYSNSPSKRIGLSITETVYDYIDDPSLLDPAVGASNFQAPGADRYVISLTLTAKPLQFGDDQNFVELVRVEGGQVSKLVDGSVYNVIDDYFAKRDYETNGDYVVQDFKLTTRTHDTDSDSYVLSVGKGLAYVHGYRTESTVQTELSSSRARTTDSQNNSPIYINYGNYLYVDKVRGNNSTFFDVTQGNTVIDLHCVDLANVNLTNTSTYTATTVATGRLRNLVYDYSTSNIDANTYVYKAFVYDIQPKTLSGTATSGSANTITLPATASYSTITGSYVGVNISLTGGTSAGDVRTITAYNGTTRVATVNSNWTTSPDNTTTFNLNFAVKDSEVMVSKTGSGPFQLTGTSAINTSSRSNGLSSGDTYIENVDTPELLFPLGSPYVSSLSGTSYTTQQLFRNISFTTSQAGVTAQINYEGAYLDVFKHLGTASTTLSNDLVRELFTIIVTDKQTNTLIKNGDVLTWNTTSRTVTMDDDSSIATFSSDDLNPFTAHILAKVYVETADNTGYVMKYKNLVKASTSSINYAGTQVNTYTFVDDTSLTSTGQVYIQNAGLVAPGASQSLYLSDVKQIVKIIDTKSSVTVPNLSMLTDSSYDITNNYLFDNGQRDSYYDHATITLKPGAPRPAGNILVLVDYYQHTGGDGYFCLTSYLTSTLQEDYTEIRSYKAKNGTIYSLRDSVDFRPSRLNAQSAFSFRLSTTGPQNYGLVLPLDGQLFTGDYSYYLGRKDKLVLSKDRTFQIIEGAPALTPQFPAEPDGSLVLANIIHRPYTGFLPTEAPLGSVADLSVEKVKHKRYTMQDVANIENRINNIEYYASLSLLEQKASSLQITDAYGLNRFKNGIMTDDFSSFGTADTLNSDFSMNINTRERVASAPQIVENFPLKSTSLIANQGNMSAAAKASLGYSVNTDNNTNFFALPYTTANVASQKFASRTVNVNPFSFSTKEGVLSISPNVDNWVDTKYAPAQLIIDPTMSLYSATDTEQYMYSDYKAIPGTTTSEKYVVGHGINPSPYGYRGYHEVNTYSSELETSYSGYYGSTYSISNNYITDISVLPYVRAQQIVIRARDLLRSTNVNTYFDGINVDGYFRKSNIIELSGVTGDFKENDTIGYSSSGTFYPTARIVGVYNKGSGNVRLYVAADPFSTKYTTTGAVGETLSNVFYNGNTWTSTAQGSVSSTIHYGGRVQAVGSSTTVTLSSLASSTTDYYVGKVLYINAPTAQSATISAYNGSTKVATLSTAISTTVGSIYSIGSFTTDETGSVYGIFNLPENTFHNGQRTFRIDNSGGNKGAETTYCDSTFYAEGLQTTQVKQTMASSPSSVQDIWVSGSKINTTLVSSTTSPWDPVAQTFMVAKQNYPNGLFLDSVTVFFKTKPLTDTAPISLSIVETLNGYPTQKTVNSSVVTLYPTDVVVSDSPQYLDSTTKTTFKFSAPVYVQPETLYAFILKSRSNEYVLHCAMAGDTALESSTKNTPTGTSNKTKLSGAPYVGGLFTSQNSQTWSVDQNQSLMFVIDQCVFSTSPATMTFVVPKKLPRRTLIEQSLQYYLDANTISSSIDTISSNNILIDAFNITTTDFIPTSTSVTYSYNSMLQNGLEAGTTYVNPGKFGTPSQDEIYLNDGKGERMLIANSDTSFSLYAQVSTTDRNVSPVISDAGLTVYGLQWDINNCELSNNLITVSNSGSGYGSSNTLVTFSAPTGKNGRQAYGVANVANGQVTSVLVTDPGSGYIETPTVSISVSSGVGAGATAIVAGETSTNGGNALTRYVSKKVVLEQGFDSGDLNVYVSAYRPVNTDIHVYYKILNRDDTQRFEDGTWQLMTKTNNCDSKYSQNRDDIGEFTFAPGTDGTDQGFVNYTNANSITYDTFNQFSIKIVLTTTDKTFVPVLYDLRTIALPSNINTTF